MFQFLHTTPLFTCQGLTIKKVKGWEKKQKMKNSHEKAGTGRKKIIHMNKLRRKKQKKKNKKNLWLTKKS